VKSKSTSGGRRPRPQDQPRSTSPVYHVDLKSVFDDLSADVGESPVAFCGFQEARDYAVKRLNEAIDQLVPLWYLVGKASCLEELDLGWYKALVTEKKGRNRRQGAGPGGEEKPSRR
jgi:hypothetical protein